MSQDRKIVVVARKSKRFLGISSTAIHAMPDLQNYSAKTLKHGTYGTHQ